ncbi:hypothetical protein SAMN02745687_01846 [Lachnospiraceae bacterium NK3A20]|nr:hypothetical protein SAMN02745687_01846 [Lachnospiraceae bacterium NK3A20]
MSDELLKGTVQEARLTKDSEEEREFYRQHTALYDLASLKTAFNGYDKKAVRDYLQKIVNEQEEQESSMTKIIDELRAQIAGLKKDKEESVQKYNRLLLAKIGGSDPTSTSDDEVGRLKRESEELQKKILVLSGKLSTMKDNSARDAERIAQLEAETQSLREKSAQLENNDLQNTTLEDARKLFEGQIRTLKETKEKLQAEIERLSQENAASEEARKKAEETLSLLQPEYKKTREQLDEATAALNRTRQESEQKAAELNSRISDLTKKNTELEELAGLAEDLKAALVRSSASEKAALQARKALEGKASTLGIQKEALMKENEQLRGSMASLQSAMEESKSYAKKLEDQINSIYSEQLNDFSENEEKDEQAQAGETEQVPAAEEQLGA